VAFRQVGILGLGLIGTSLGLALKRGSDAPRIIGFDLASEQLHQAARQGAIDRSAGALTEVCGESDVLVLATPVRAILSLLPEVAPHLASETLVTDTGGTKGEIVRAAERALGPGNSFVGGHPLAGRLTAGVSQASASLFHGAVYCLTPGPGAQPRAVEAAVELVERVGAQPLFLDPEEHDALLASVSHLPYFASVALVNALASQSAWSEMASMASGGFRAASSLVDGSPGIWADVAATNRQNVVRQLDALVQRLTGLSRMIADGDEGLLAELQRAHAAHQRWLAARGQGSAPEGPAAPSPRRSPGWMDRLLGR
jgi:prephenate dehydrogenase